MILDSLATLTPDTLPLFKDELAFLRNFDGTPWEGRRDIRPGKSFALYQSYTPKPAEAAKFEAHRKWIDLQFVWKGRESMLHAHLSKLAPADTPYDPDRDAALWSNSLVSDFSTLKLESGDVAVFFPHDVHAPGIKADSTEPVVKVVVKVAV